MPKNSMTSFMDDPFNMIVSTYMYDVVPIKLLRRHNSRIPEVVIFLPGYKSIVYIIHGTSGRGGEEIQIKCQNTDVEDPSSSVLFTTRWANRVGQTTAREMLFAAPSGGKTLNKS